MLDWLKDNQTLVIIIAAVLLFGDKLLPLITKVIKPSTTTTPTPLIDAITTLVSECEDCGDECCTAASKAISEAIPSLIKHRKK